MDKYHVAGQQPDKDPPERAVKWFIFAGFGIAPQRPAMTDGSTDPEAPKSKFGSAEAHKDLITLRFYRALASVIEKRRA